MVVQIPSQPSKPATKVSQVDHGSQVTSFGADSLKERLSAIIEDLPVAPPNTSNLFSEIVQQALLAALRDAETTISDNSKASPKPFRLPPISACCEAGLTICSKCGTKASETPLTTEFVLKTVKYKDDGSEQRVLKTLEHLNNQRMKLPWKKAEAAIAHVASGWQSQTKRYPKQDLSNIRSQHMEEAQMLKGYCPEEAEIMKMLDDPHIAKVEHVVRGKGVALLLISPRARCSLREALKATEALVGISRRRPASLQAFTQIRRLTEVLSQVAVCATCTVERMHAADVVHGDLKPGNMVLDSSGRLFVIDFGNAEVQVAGKSRKEPWQLLFTDQFAAIELLFQKHMSRRSDIFALGVIVTMIRVVCAGESLRAVGECLPIVGDNEPEVRRKLVKLYELHDRLDREPCLWHEHFDHLLTELPNGHALAAELRRSHEAWRRTSAVVKTMLAANASRRPSAHQVAKTLIDIAPQVFVPLSSHNPSSARYASRPCKSCVGKG